MLRNSDRFDSICFASPNGAAEGTTTIIDTSGCILVTKFFKSIDGKHTSFLDHEKVYITGPLSGSISMSTQATTRLIGISGNAVNLTIV
jgi:hypothetical protein